MTGSGLSGNKVRKLEYLIADARRLGADTLITCGGVQSNHCRATSIAAARVGMGCRLLLRGNKPADSDGNLLLDRLVGAIPDFVSEEKYITDSENELDRIASEVLSEGGKPYIIPEGGSNYIGAWGYVDASKEAFDQCNEMDFQPDRIICATGSGGTHAGLLVGARMLNWQVEITSIAVCYSKDETIRRVFSIVNDMIDMYDLDFKIDPGEINVIDGYIGPGYAQANPEIYKVIVEVARHEGVLVDPVYTGKAAWAIREEIAAGSVTGKTIFWHTGGVFGIFPFRRELQDSF